MTQTKPFRKLRRRFNAYRRKEALVAARQAARDAARSLDWKAAAQLWQAVLDDFPNNSSGGTLARLAQAQRELSRPAEAEATISRGLAIYPRHPSLILEAVECAMLRKNWTEVVAHLESIAKKKLSLSSVSRRIAGAVFRMLEEGQIDIALNYHVSAKTRFEQRCGEEGLTMCARRSPKPFERFRDRRWVPIFRI